MAPADRAPAAGAEPMATDAAPAPAYAEGNVHDLMKLFYSRLFPSRDLHRWLAYGHDAKLPHADATFFQRREFCFTLENDIFVRYQSFKDGAELHNALRERCPGKIDIGPLFNVDPQKRAAYGGGLGSERVFAPVERELVFDVDMTDYDDIRTCCSGGAVCTKCWPFMTVAVKVVDTIMREDFGFQHILWVYSGRRGVHCWVCDEKARQLTNDQRSAVAEFFAVTKGNEEGAKKVNISFPLHPSLQRAYNEVLLPTWRETIVPEQGLLENQEQLDGVLAMVPDEGVREVLAERLKSGKRFSQNRQEDAAQRWAFMEREVQRGWKQAKNPTEAFALLHCLEKIVFAHTFPRLDLEVSKHMNHLLKSPFCVHPKTGRVCVPINPATAEEFDPGAVPTVAQLLNELNANSADAGEDFEKTSLRHAIAAFRENFLDPLLLDSRQKLQQKAQEANARPTTEW